MPIIERPTTVEREEDRREFDKLFGDLSDGNDSELDFVPKKKMKLDREDDDTNEELDEDDSDHESFEMDSSGGEDGDSDEIGDDETMETDKD